MDLKSRFGLRGADNEFVVILEIGSASVAGALAVLHKDESPQLIYTTRSEFPVEKNFDSGQFTTKLKSSLDSVLSDLVNLGMNQAKLAKLNKIPRQAFCFLGAPWYTSHNRTVKISRGQPFIVTKKFMDEVIQNEVKKATQEEDVLIEDKTLSASLNGYKVENPYNHKAQNLELLLYLSFAPKDFIENIRTQISNTLHFDDIQFHTFTLAFFSVLRDTQSSEPNFLLINVTGEITEVSVVKSGALKETISFPFGRNVILRKLTELLQISTSEAASLFSVYAGGKSDIRTKERIESAIGKIEEEWLGDFERTLANLSAGLYLPYLTFVTVGQPFSDWFTKVIQKGSSTQLTVTEKPFVVNLADEAAFSSFAHFSPSASHDPFLVIGTLFANKIYFL